MKPPATPIALLFLLGSTIAHAQPQRNRFDHIVVIVQENRTPDNLFGSNPSFEPGVDLATSGLNSRGKQIPLKPDALAGCYDLSHMHSAFVQMYDNGKMDGADKVQVQPNAGCNLPTNPQFRYVDNSQGTVQPYFDLASQYGWANRMFQTNQGPSFPAHQFLLSGTSAPTTNSNLFAAENPVSKGGGRNNAGCIAPSDTTVKLVDPQGNESSKQYPCFEHPTLTDLLDNAPNGPIDWRYYTSSPGSIWTAPNAIKHMCVPETQGGSLVCTGSDWVDHVVLPQTKVLNDIDNCKLAPVSWVIPDGAASRPRSNQQRPGAVLGRFHRQRNWQQRLRLLAGHRRPDHLGRLGRLVRPRSALSDRTRQRLGDGLCVWVSRPAARRISLYASGIRG